jgi:uncharacterized protein HemX
MSTPDDPTRRIPPVPPPGDPPPVAREREVYADDEGVWRREVIDRLDSLRTGLVVVALLAVAALALAGYSLLADEDDGGNGRDGASRSQDRASQKAVDSLRSDQREIVDRVEAVEDAASDGGDTEALQESIDQLSQDIEALDQRVAEVEQRQEEQEQQPAP